METILGMGKKHGRHILLIFSGIITGFLFIAPPYFPKEAAATIVEGRSEWMILFAMIVSFYFKNKEAADTTTP